MTTAEAEPQPAPEETPTGAAPGDGADAEVQATEVQTGPACTACGAALSGGQDWCLECGTAVRKARRTPGLRSVGVAGALALLLAGGAVAASYAALSDEPPQRATKVTTIAEAAPAPVTTQTTPTVDDVEPLPPAEDIEPVEPVEPVDPVTPVTPVTPTQTTPKDDTSKDDTPKDDTPKEPVFTPITLDVTAGALYDPDVRATATGDPQRALDGKTGTSWFATTPPDGDMNVGYRLDLGKSQTIKRLEIVTKTPGFTIRVLGARGGKPPAKSDDADWVVLGEAGSVDAKPATGANAPAVAPAKDDEAGDTRLRLDLAADDEIFRHVLLWVSVPPTAGPTVRFSTIRLLQ